MIIECTNDITSDPRFLKALELFNSAKWYFAHDVFEELWHENNGPERLTLQGLLQVSVAEVHLGNGNLNGATILLGEGLGRLRDQSSPDLGLDIEDLCENVEIKLRKLQKNQDTNGLEPPLISFKG